MQWKLAPPVVVVVVVVVVNCLRWWCLISWNVMMWNSLLVHGTSKRPPGSVPSSVVVSALSLPRSFHHSPRRTSGTALALSYSRQQQQQQQQQHSRFSVSSFAHSSNQRSWSSYHHQRCFTTSVAILDLEPCHDEAHDAATITTTTTRTKRQQRQQQDGNNKFHVTAPHEPTGDQPQAIQTLVDQIRRGDKYSVLRGITGSGKSFVMAHTIARLGRPTLVLCHNKTLAAQLARELRSTLARNHVQLFVSYYNHYVPESYNEKTDKYTAKKSSVNDELDALRHLATRSLVQHSDVVVVASVSCIYGLGMPRAYLDASLQWTVGDVIGVTLSDIQSEIESLLYVTPEEDSSQDDLNADGTTSSGGGDDLNRGNYQLAFNSSTGDASLMIWPPSETFPIRVTLARDDVGFRISSIGHGHSMGMESVTSTTIFPAKHHISGSEEEFEESLGRIQQELLDRVKELRDDSKHAEADRLSQRVGQDLLLLRETGSCPGVENYSRHMSLREAGVAPDTLLDYFGYSTAENDWLLIVDESHVALPQLKAMYGGDRARKERLVKFGYRLPSALDNRPLRSDEFWRKVPQAVFVSATPSKHELELIADKNEPVDMLIRPTHVCDPEINVRPIKNQLDDLLYEIQTRAQRDERSLAMTLTKRDAEDLADYLIEHGVSASYIHSGLNTHERSNALKALQNGEIDCLVGVNLLREGLDLPQVSLVAILNADSEGFLRSETALLQTIGRAARNIHGKAILYANRVTASMQKCIDATAYRREVQLRYNKEHGKEMKSTKGSSVLSIFDLLKDQIEAEKPLEVIQSLEFDGATAKESGTFSLPLDVYVDKYSRQIKKRVEGIETDHLPSKPGVYMWKDGDGNILYIGKAKKLRSRVKSYLSKGAKHSPRIRVMLNKAECVEFMLTPSDRDALILENNLIKHYKPAYNVLLKDDESYPSICATIGDAYPTFTIVPRRQEGEKAAKYRYFGPYPHYSEINRILQGIEETYDLRSKSFQARFGDLSKSEYQQMFQKVLQEVFESNTGENSLAALRYNYEEASNLFDSEYNESRDIVAVGKSDDSSAVIVHVLQLRSGMITGQFSYECQLAAGLTTEEDFADAIQLVLEKRHYPSGGSTTGMGHSFFPDEILLQYPLPETAALKEVVRSCEKSAASGTGMKNKKLAVRIPAIRGVRKESDSRALQCAIENADQVANQKALVNMDNVPLSSVDGRAIDELASVLSLAEKPRRIECYDISHTQGEGTVGSRVVFIDGKPAPHLYRIFNIQSVDGPDDYASLEEVLERRFRRVWQNGNSGELVDDSDPWSLPDLVVIDGGKGQLNAAIKGMAKSNILPKRGHLRVLSPSSIDDEDAPWVDDGDTLVIEEEEFPPQSGHQTRVPIVALAKRNEEVFARDMSAPLINNDSGYDSSALLLLRALRDESHRFALNAHRKRRTKINGM